MKLKSFGCSFLFGTDLGDYKHDNLYPQPSLKTWPALLAKELDMQYVCLAHGGSGNLSILDRILKTVNSQESVFYCINWTYIDRFDYTDPLGGPTTKNDWKSLTPGSIEIAAEVYYRDLHSEYKDKLASLIYIKTAIEFLLANNCPFIMTFMDDLILDKQYHTNKGIEYLQNYVSPYLHKFDGMNFLDWSRHHRFDISPNQHPLEEAHAAASRYMLPEIQNWVTNNKPAG